jgi:uridine kinase
VWDQITDPAAPQDVAAVVDLARVAAPRCGQTVVVAIDGPSGSGKTTLARGVVEALGCPVAHMDQIFPGWDGLAAAVPLVTEQVLEPIARGERAAYRTWDWAEDRWNGTITLPLHRFLVVEGCGSSVGSAGSYAAVRVWVDAPRDVRLARGLARDGQAYAPHWQRWADQEGALFAADGTRERADVVIETGHWS